MPRQNRVTPYGELIAAPDRGMFWGNRGPLLDREGRLARYAARDVGEPALRDFLARGYTTQNALEIVLGIGTYTMSTLANRLTGAPVDGQLAAHAWHPETS